ncbi:endospore germination permease [Bacillus sp. B190/17]|uniref:Endospore germination permease n=1 Tax=Bacillus lumedeiriae TaxID=3058829 RepID=A0ABW8IBN5_9BACI
MEKGKISSLQMAMLLYPTIVATAILSVPSITAKYAKQDLWMSPIIASFIGFITVFIAVRLHKLYPDQTIIQMSQQIVGQVLGKVISFFILFFYIHINGEIIREYAEFIVSSFLFQTPITVIIASMTLLCGLAVYGGLEVVGRAAQLFFPLFVIPILLFVPLLSPNFELGSMLPILERGMLPPIKGAIVTSGWFTEFFLIIFLLPFLVDKDKGMKYGMMTVLAVMVTLTVVNLVVLWTLGVTTSSKEYPLMNAGRYISYADFFENVEAVIMAVWIIGAFVKVSVLYYAAVLGTAQWLDLADYRPIVWPVGIFLVQFSFWSFPNTMEISRFNILTFPFYGFFIQTMVPLLLLVIAVIKKRKQAGGKAG